MANRLQNAGSFEATDKAGSYTDLAGAYMDYDSSAGYAQVGAKGTVSNTIGLKLRTILAGVAMTVMSFTAAGQAFMNSPSAANGAEYQSLLVSAGSDGTLGPMGLQVALFPSATAGNRYARLVSGDSTGFRQMRIDATSVRFGDVSGAGIVVVGASQFNSTLQVNGQLLANQGTNRNFAVVTDATQLGSAGIAVGSFVDGFGAYAPLSLVSSVVRVLGATSFDNGVNVGSTLVVGSDPGGAQIARIGGDFHMSGAALIGNGVDMTGSLTVREASGGTQLYLIGGGTRKNWQIGKQTLVDQSISFTPSTVVGGLTFTTPTFVLGDDGSVIIASLAGTGSRAVVADSNGKLSAP